MRNSRTIHFSGTIIFLTLSYDQTKSELLKQLLPPGTHKKRDLKGKIKDIVIFFQHLWNWLESRPRRNLELRSAEW